MKSSVRFIFTLFAMLLFTLQSPAGLSQQNCSAHQLSIELLTDDYGQETHWQLTDGTGSTRATGGDFDSNTSYADNLCLEPGLYTFSITDSYGDGLCCNYGNGFYRLRLNAQTVASGGQFTHRAQEEITLSDNNPNACNHNSVNLTLATDNYGRETAWAITRDDTVIHSGEGYASNEIYRESFCLTDANYHFTITDSYGDGICCDHGNGYYELSIHGTTLASGGDFNSSESQGLQLPINDGGGDNNDDLDQYYAPAQGLTGTALKTKLHEIIGNHSVRSYSSLWDFYLSYEIDSYYENNYTILDIYSENPHAPDPYSFTPGTDQCGTYNSEADCYNREHSFPRSWFGGSVAPMNSDIHHIFATDGQVNAWRGSYPFGEVGSASRISQNGSKLGVASNSLGYSGTVFEPIDEFKGDLARAYFYMATRYQDRIASWRNNSANGATVLDGSSTQVFTEWQLQMLLRWHSLDPVSVKEVERNNAAQSFQGNRNPFIDHPEWVEQIW